MSVLSKPLPQVAKIVAAMASFVPLAFTYETMSKRLSHSQRQIVSSPPFVLAMAFGTGYAASTDIKATLYAIVIVATFISMLDDLVSPTTDTQDNKLQCRVQVNESRTKVSREIK